MTDRSRSQEERTSEVGVVPERPIERIRELVDETNYLQAEINDLKLRLLRYERRPSNTFAYYLVFLGACCLIFSVIWTSQILAFIGLGLAFWGALLFYARPVAYVPGEIVSSAAISAIRAMDQIVGRLGYKGRSIYLPPMTLKDIKDSRMFLPEKDETRTPPADIIRRGALASDDPVGVFLVPPGLGLANLFEEKLGVRFAEADLEYLKANLPRLLVENLRLLDDLKLKDETDEIEIEMDGSAFASLCSKVRDETEVSARFGCPLCSAIAIVIARTSHRPIVIEVEEAFEGEGKILARYRMLPG